MSEVSPSAAEPSASGADDPHPVPRMFDRISHRYDLLNHLLSMGQDIVWRNRAARMLASPDVRAVLDLATGTGDLLLAVCRKNPAVQRAVGLDLAAKMVAIGREKVVKADLQDRVTFDIADAAATGLDANGFDAITIAFGIRNIPEPQRALNEMFRLARPGGRVLVLEFSLPGNPILRPLYLFYFRHILPVIGGLISGDKKAYRYLNNTVEEFPYGAAFCAMLEASGFGDVKAQPVTFGIATIYTGVKPSS